MASQLASGASQMLPAGPRVQRVLFHWRGNA